MELIKYIIDNSTSIISLCGAFAGLVSILNYIDDRPKLNVTANIVHVLQSNNNDLRSCIQLTFTNLGKRPINLIKWYWKNKNDKGQFSFLGNAKQIEGDLPQILKESEFYKIRWYIESSSNFKKFTNKNFDTFYVEDSNGKNWKMNNKNKKHFIRTLSRVLSDEDVPKEEEITNV